MRPAAPLSVLLACACLCSFSHGCNLDNPGDSPARGSLYFPTGLALSSSTATSPARFLYVVNSNFDLRYNAGSVQAYDLTKLDEQITERCPERVGVGGIECEIDSADVLIDEVLITSFARGIASDPDHTRLYVPTRTDSSLTFIDVDEGGNGKGKRVLSCGSKTARSCDDDHRRGDDSVQNERRLRLPAEPVGLVTGRAADLAQAGETPIAGNYVLVAHRGGQVSLFLDDAEGAKMSGPLLTDVIEGLSLEPTAIAFDAQTQRAYLSVYDRYGIGSPIKALARVGVAINDVRPADSLLYNVGEINLDGVGLSRDTRSVAFPDPASAQALVISRQPAALLWVDVLGASDGGEATRAVTKRIVNVGDGPSRLTLGTVDGRSVVIVSCFDARQLYVIDAVSGEVLSIVHNLSGPFEVVLDAARKRVYAADFRSSAVRVIDLAPVLTDDDDQSTEAKIVATLGVPKLIQELQ